MWLVLPSSVCAAASAASTSLSDSACQALASSATWRGKPMPPRFWLRAWQRETWMRRLSGATCDLSTATRGVASWMESLRATRASHSASPAADAESRTRGTCGPTSGASSARSARDGSSPRTSPATWALGSPRSWPTLPPSGSMRHGVCSPLPAVEPSTCAGGSTGWVPTPTAKDADQSARHTTRTGNSNPGTSLVDYVRLYPTPRASDYRSGKASEATHAKNSRPLCEAIGGLLNPQWVEWLMGFPLGWTEHAGTASTPSATRLCRQSPRGRSACSLTD